MTTPNAAHILRAPGRLCIAPTDLSLAYPHGGTALGVVRACAIRTNLKFFPVTAEEFGSTAVEWVSGGSSPGWALAALLRDWDPDVVSRVFPNVSTGAVSQHPLVTGGAADTQRAGHLLSGRAVKLLFSPDSPDAPGLLLLAAIPMTAQDVDLQLANAEPLELMVLFAAIRAGDGREYAMGRLVDMTL